MLSTVAALLKVGRLMYLPVLALALLIGGAVASGAGGASATLGVLIGLFVGFIVGAALFRRIAARRARRFTAEAPRVLAAIAEGESSAAAAVTQAA
jgi:positive regulator of sigma E activity